MHFQGFVWLRAFVYLLCTAIQGKWVYLQHGQCHFSLWWVGFYMESGMQSVHSQSEIRFPLCGENWKSYIHCICLRQYWQFLFSWLQLAGSRFCISFFHIYYCCRAYCIRIVKHFSQLHGLFLWLWFCIFWHRCLSILQNNWTIRLAGRELLLFVWAVLYFLAYTQSICMSLELPLFGSIALH